MPIQVQCDECGKEHRVADTSAGKRFHCKGCQAELTVSSPKNGETRRSSPSKKSARKERVQADEYDDEEYLDELSTRKSTRRASSKKRARGSGVSSSLGSVLSWAWNMDSIVREGYVALAFVFASLALGLVEQGQTWVSTMVFGLIVGVALTFKGAIWMWLELFHVNKTLWFLGFVMGPIPGLQQIWALTCLALHFDDLKRPLQEHLIGIGLAVAMPCVWYGFSMALAR